MARPVLCGAQRWLPLLGIVLFIAIVIVVAAVLAAFTAAAAIPTFLLAFVTASAVPVCVRKDIQLFNRHLWIIAFDHQLATTRTLFGCLVANYEVQARSRIQRRRERV